ncbi:MAG TPA: rhodanese-like domain-containing protein [Candidatus Polarisedimenticolia bacterium]|nr:rhodanese-like domain-containing protein [Candidatus Polarisedimenticolia bacterium]
MSGIGTRGVAAWIGRAPALAGALALAGLLQPAGVLGSTGVASAAAAESFRKVSPAEVAAWQERGEAFLFVDVRPQGQYEMKHARGALNIPAFALSSKPLPRAAKVVLYDDGTGTAEAEGAARALRALGQPDFSILDGGLTAWEGRGLPIVTQPGRSASPLVEPIGAEDLLRLIDSGARLALLDLRGAGEFAEGRIPGARSAATPALLAQAVARLQPADLIVLYDGGGGEARDSAEQLRRKGFRAVKYLHGGTLAWIQKGLREEK